MMTRKLWLASTWPTMGVNFPHLAMPPALRLPVFKLSKDQHLTIDPTNWLTVNQSSPESKPSFSWAKLVPIIWVHNPPLPTFLTQAHVQFRVITPFLLQHVTGVPRLYSSLSLTHPVCPPAVPRVLSSPHCSVPREWMETAVTLNIKWEKCK